MSKATRNIISLIANILIVVFTIYSILSFWFTTGEANMQVNGPKCFVYFTNDSNIIAAIASIIMIIFNIKRLKNIDTIIPKWLTLTKFATTISVTVTFITVVIFLSPMDVINGFSYFRMFKGICFFLHFLTPLLCIFLVCFIENENKISNKEMLLGLAPTLIYSIVYITMVIFIKAWEDFYGFTLGGKLYMAPIMALAMYGLTLLLSFIEQRIHNKMV